MWLSISRVNTKCNNAILYRIYRIYKRNGYCRYYDTVLSIQYLVNPLQHDESKCYMKTIDASFNIIYAIYM